MSPPRSSSSPVQPLIIRSWPRIVLMLPTLFTAILCGVIMAVYGMPTTDAAFGPLHYVGLVFLLILALNLTILLYDLSLKGFVMVALLIIAVVLGLYVLNQSREGRLWETLGDALKWRIVANAAFYFTFALVLLFNLLIAWVITRFNYWKVEHNEIIIHRGFLQEQERHPTAQARFKLVIEDIVEYGILGCGKLIFYFGDSETTEELPTVLFVHRKARRLDDLLGRVAVVSHS